MMKDLRKYLVILVIAILFSAFVFTLIQAVYPQPKYENFCGRSSSPMKPDSKCEGERSFAQERDECYSLKGEPRNVYDENGCVIEITCDHCREDFDKARENYSLAYFIICAILGVISIIIGLLLPNKPIVNNWIGSGLLLGGLIVIFGGTIVSLGDLQSYIRPIILLLELVLVIYLAVKLWGNEK